MRVEIIDLSAIMYISLPEAAQELADCVRQIMALHSHSLRTFCVVHPDVFKKEKKMLVLVLNQPMFILRPNAARYDDHLFYSISDVSSHFPKHVD